MTSPLLSNDEQRRIGLRVILGAWDAALGQGVEPEMLASSALYAAFTDMVDIHGAEAVANFAATLPDRIRAGEFTPSNDAPPV